MSIKCRPGGGAQCRIRYKKKKKNGAILSTISKVLCIMYYQTLHPTSHTAFLILSLAPLSSFCSSSCSWVTCWRSTSSFRFPLQADCNCIDRSWWNGYTTFLIIRMNDFIQYSLKYLKSSNASGFASFWSQVFLDCLVHRCTWLLMSLHLSVASWSSVSRVLRALSAASSPVRLSSPSVTSRVQRRSSRACSSLSCSCTRASSSSWTCRSWRRPYSVSGHVTVQCVQYDHLDLHWSLMTYIIQYIHRNLTAS